MEHELIKGLINAGVGGVIAGIIIFLTYRLANNFGMKFIETQQSQAVAINNLCTCIEKSMTKDQLEHREIIILLKVISEKIERIDHNGSKERTV